MDGAIQPKANRFIGRCGMVCTERAHVSVCAQRDVGIGLTLS